MTIKNVITMIFLNILVQSGIQAQNPVKTDTIPTHTKIHKQATNATTWCLSSGAGAFIGGLLLGPTLYQNMQNLDYGKKMGRRWLCATPMRLFRVICAADIFGQVMGLNRDNSFVSKAAKKFQKS